MLCAMRSPQRWFVAFAVTTLAACQTPPKPAADGGAKAVDEADGVPAAAEVTAGAAETPAVEDELLPDDPNDFTPPDPLVDLAREVVEGMNAETADLLNEPLMPKEIYVSDRMTYGLAKNRKIAEKVSRQFLWDNLWGDSDDDRVWLHRTWVKKPSEFVSVRVNEHVDKEEIELWKGTVLRVREKATGRQVDLLILGEDEILAVID